MSDTKKTFLDKYKDNLWINIANTFIVLASVLAMLTFLILGFTYLSMNWGSDISIGGDSINQWVFLLLLPVCALAALAGIISVVASNNKFPILLLVLSSISTLYKFSYALVQWGTGQAAINSSVLIGQPIMFILLFVQVFYWIKWNKITDEGKFYSETFKGKRTYIAFAIIGVIWLAQLGLSIYANDTFFSIAMDWSGAILYTTAAMLMAFGNILCFPFFLLSDISWLYWTINDLVTSDSIIMTIWAITTLIEVLAYTGLAITGFIQWFNDDFEIVDWKVRRKAHRTLETNL